MSFDPVKSNSGEYPSSSSSSSPSPSSSSRPSPCKMCRTVLGRINCTHLSNQQCAALKARKMMRRRAKTSEKGEQATDAIMQVYACPGRHTFEGTAALGSRSMIHRPGDRELLPGMCPHCWSETINDGYSGGRRKWAQDTVTLVRKEPRISKGWVMQRRVELEMKSFLEENNDGEGKGGKSTKRRKDKRWTLSKDKEVKFRMQR